MSFYEEMTLVAASLLSQFGAVATLSLSTQTFNKQTNRVQTSTASTSACLAVVRPIEITDDQGRLLKQTQAVLNVLPVEGGKLTMGDTTWTIGKVTVVKPIGTPIIYMAEVM